MIDSSPVKGFSWKGRRVMVTGADGFMGSHLAERLLKQGASVTVYVRGNSINGTHLHTLKNTAHLEKRFRLILTGDIAAADAIDLIRDDAPEYIFHLAADAYVPNSFSHPIEVFETNLTGTLHVLQAARKIKRLKRVVCTSSCEVYGTAQYAPIDETHPLNPTSPYAASKASADRAAWSWWNTYGLPGGIIRPFHTYGPRHTYDVIPKFIALALQGKTLTVHGSGKQTRDFTYIDDMVRGFLIMGSHPEAVGRVVNFGTGKDVAVKDIAQKIVRLSGSASPIVHTDERAAQGQRLICGWKPAHKLFGFRPTVDIDEGLRRNIEWARVHQPRA